MSGLENKAKSYRDIAQECFFGEDLKFGEQQFMGLSTTKEWVRLEDAFPLEAKLNQIQQLVTKERIRLKESLCFVLDDIEKVLEK